MALDSLYKQLQTDRLQRFEAALASGAYRPFVWPWDTLPALWLFLGMLVLPRLPLQTARTIRVPLLILIFAQGTWSITRCRSIGMAGGYGIGLANDWGFIMTLGLLCFKDLKKDFQRLETRPCNELRQENVSNGSALSSAREQNGSAMQRSTSGQLRKQAKSEHLPPPAEAVPYKLVWQRYPQNVWHCASWLTDLLMSFRGVNWSWRLAIFPPLEDVPKPTSTDSPCPSSQSRAYATPQTIIEIRRHAVRSFILLYLGVDLAKTLVIHDPYYLGLAPIDSPHPLWLLQPYPILARVARLLLSLYSVIAALSFIFSLSPLIYPILPLLFLKLPLSTGSPLLTPSMYPPYWSRTPLTDLSRSGLAAFWGKIWHSMFRAGISHPAAYLTDRLSLPPRSLPARALQLFVAFTLTGSIHAVAAYTSFPPNPARPPQPLANSGAFFVLQACAILAQTAVAGALHSKAWPRWARAAGNVAFTVVWLYFTGPMLASDFARAGVWMFEPVPVSPLRGLLGEGWWCWGGRWAGLVTSGPWYRRGIAIY